jgi:hypothetical protein
MTTHTIKRYLSVLVFTAGMFSCTDLDENLYDLITAEETELTADDLNTIIAPAFTRFQAVYWGWNGLFDVYEESSDLIVTPYRIGNGWGDLYLDLHKHQWGPFIEHANNLWISVYNGITYANKAMLTIETIPNVEGKEFALAELRALRAIYYYILFDNFRGVPLVTTFDLPKGYLPEHNSAKEVYDFIESELTEVMPLLTETVDRSTYGRVTRWAAKMTLAKLYLNSEVYFGTARWADALVQVEDVINSGNFALQGSYADNFKVANDAVSNKEQIFTIPFDDINAPGSYYPYKTLHALSQPTFNMRESPWGGSCGIPQFIDTYDEEDSRFTDCWLGGPQYTSSGEPIMFNGEQFTYINSVTSADGAEYNEGFRFVKYEIAGLDGKGNDVPFYRYADALMIQAECLLRSGGAAGADQAAAIVTEIRRRAFRNNPDKAVVTGAELLEGSRYNYGPYAAGVITEEEGGEDIVYGRFLDELAWEFVGEHHRKQDLIRFKTTEENKSVYIAKSWLTHKPSAKFREVYPIPQPQRETNSNLGQNDGY